MAEEIVKAYDVALKKLLDLKQEVDMAIQDVRDDIMIARREALKRLREGEPGGKGT